MAAVNISQRKKKKKVYVIRFLVNRYGNSPRTGQQTLCQPPPKFNESAVDIKKYYYKRSLSYSSKSV
jgi:hypothetical protein